MKESSTEQCKYLMDISVKELRKAFDRLARHAGLVTNLMDPEHKIGKALRSIKWLDEEPYKLNAYGGESAHSWNIIERALMNAYIDDGDISYVTLIPGKMELHNASDELILEFASKEDYYRLIVELKLIIDKE